jgi:hypothetical protein
MHLAEHCNNCRVIMHSGEHYVPTSAAWRHFFRDFMVSFAEPDDAWRSIPAPDTEVTSHKL